MCALQFRYVDYLLVGGAKCESHCQTRIQRPCITHSVKHGRGIWTNIQDSAIKQERHEKEKKKGSSVRAKKRYHIKQNNISKRVYMRQGHRCCRRKTNLQCSGKSIKKYGFVAPMTHNPD